MLSGYSTCAKLLLHLDSEQNALDVRKALDTGTHELDAIMFYVHAQSHMTRNDADKQLTSGWTVDFFFRDFLVFRFFFIF